MDTNILQVKNLGKVYKDGSKKVIALDSVNFILRKGEDLGILGPSGSGKTTLLQLAGGLDKRSSGEVIINGININKLNDNELSHFRNKTMGFIFQMINLHDFLSAKENIMLPMLIAGVKRKDAEKRALELLDQIGLKERADHTPGKLSGGEQQRVAVARALANKPQLIFADEPTGKLDQQNSKAVISLLENISHEQDTSVVMITHDEKIAKKFSRVIHLEDGKVKSDNTI